MFNICIIKLVIGVCASIKIDKSVPPVRQSFRRIPIPLEELTLLKLRELEDHDIIERVYEACEWVSPMLIKRKNATEVRIIIDLREANKAVIREVHPLPTLEQMISRLRNSKIFAKFDIKHAFHQIMLREDCRYITTFISPLGLMRYKRLMFGLSAAPEIFQKCMESILGGFPWLIIYIDDILIHATDEETLKQRITIVKKRLLDNNIILNDKKTVECVTEIEFLGYTLSENGVKISEEKLAAIKLFREPRSAEEVRSFLGLVTFVNRYIPHLSTLASPLNNLIKKSTQFEWTNVHQKAFDDLKDGLAKQETLAYFDPNLETFVMADASPVGLGGVLFQKNSDNIFRIICYASKSLSDVERRYAQTEREALALVWAPEKFHYYLYGKFFWLITDHKPLVTIFDKRSKSCARIERWKLRLMSYDYKVIFRPGKSNIADPLSRLCQDKLPHSASFDEESERIVRLISLDACPIALSLNEIIEATRSDIELTELMEWISYPVKRWPKTLHRYKLISSDLSTDGRIVLKNMKIIIPRILQGKILQLAHEPHLGIDSMKKRLREKVWWVNIDNMVVQFVKRCTACLLVSEPNFQPMTRIAMPDGPWLKLAIDFTEITTGVHLLVVVDYFSRYPEIEIMTTTTAKMTIFKLRIIFARFGLPEELVCDNGPPFTSNEFVGFCRTNGIVVSHSTPYAPFQNGLVERFNRTLLKTVKISSALGRDWKSDLFDFLLAYRATPHSVTNASPAQLLFGRNVKDKLPSIPSPQHSNTWIKLKIKDQENKEKGKVYGDQKRKAIFSKIDVGDHVLVKNFIKRNKLTTNFNPQPHEVIKKHGTRLTLKNLANGVEMDRHVNHTKQLSCGNPFKIITDRSADEDSREQDNTEEPHTNNIVNNQRKRKHTPPNYLNDYVVYNCNQIL